MPHVRRSGSQALGLVLDIDLCCLAHEVEKLTGKKLYHLTVTEPAFEWDCDELIPTEDDQLVRRGNPVKWMLERCKEMGIKVKNLRL